MKNKNLGTPLSKSEMKDLKGGIYPCEPPVCSGTVCPNCKFHCEFVNDLETVCVRNGQQPVE